MKVRQALRSGSSLGVRGAASLLLLTFLATPVLAGEQFRRLDGKAVSARLGGREITDEVHWSHRLERDGRLTSFSLGRARTGTWKVNGDELCLDRPVDGTRCFEVWLAGNRVELRREPAPPEEGVVKPAR